MGKTLSEVAMIWRKALSKIEKRMEEKQIFDTFFENSYINEYKGNTYYIVVSSAVAVTLMENKYRDLIVDAIEEVSGEKCNISVLNKSQISNPSNDRVETKTEATYFKDSKINPESTFDSFVVGQFNNEAFKAAEMAAQNPGKIFNPLFIYSNSG